MPNHALTNGENLTVQERVQQATEIQSHVAEYWRAAVRNAVVAAVVAGVCIVLVAGSAGPGVAQFGISVAGAFTAFGVVGAASIALQVAVRDRRNARDTARAFALETVAVFLASATVVALVAALKSVFSAAPVNLLHAGGVFVSGVALFAIAVDAASSTADLREILDTGDAHRALPLVERGARKLGINTPAASARWSATIWVAAPLTLVFTAIGVAHLCIAYSDDALVATIVCVVCAVVASGCSQAAIRDHLTGEHLGASLSWLTAAAFLAVTITIVLSGAGSTPPYVVWAQLLSVLALPVATFRPLAARWYRKTVAEYNLRLS